MSYLKDLKLILTLHVNQFLINMEKRIFALLRGYCLCRQKKPRQKLFELAVCDQFESSHRSLSNVIVVLISSPPPLPPPAPNTVFIHILQGHKLVLVRGGGRICHYFDTELPPASTNTLLCTVSRSFGPNVQYLTGKVI